MSSAAQPALVASASGESGWVDTSRNGPPASQVHIDADVARSLVATLPQFADAPLGRRFDGWDMAVFRLGDHHALRLPRTEPAVTSLGVELRVLTDVGARWTFPRPRIVHVGEPSPAFRWPWAITTWLDGTTADFHPLDADGGASVGEALAQVHTAATADAPHNPEQSIGLAARADQLEWALALVGNLTAPSGERLDLRAARALWERAAAAAEPPERVWSHADGHGSNLLSDHGSLVGIIDWGKAAACDRAVDLGFLYTAMPALGVERAIAAYREATGVDDAGLEARARGIALAKAAAWATLAREANVLMAWRAFAGLGVLASEAEL